MIYTILDPSLLHHIIPIFLIFREAHYNFGVFQITYFSSSIYLCLVYRSVFLSSTLSSLHSHHNFLSPQTSFLIRAQFSNEIISRMTRFKTPPKPIRQAVLSSSSLPDIPVHYCHVFVYVIRNSKIILVIGLRTQGL